MRRQFLSARMLTRRSKGQLQLFPLTLGLYFGPADPRLQFQQFQLCLRECFAPWSVLFDPYQTQSFFQDTDLILCEPEPIPIKGQRAVELFE